LKYRFFGEPGLHIMDSETGHPLYKFDDNGEIVLSDDNPFLKRMMNHYQHEPVEPVAVNAQPEQDVTAEPFKFNCRKCSFETNNHGAFLAHCKKEHPKEVK